MMHKPSLTPAESLLLPGAEPQGRSRGFDQWPGSVAVNGSVVHYDFLEPTEPREEAPIIINNGFCAPAIVYDALAAAIAQNGRRVVRQHPPRHVPLHMAIFDGHAANPLKKHAQAAQAVIEDVSSHIGVDRFDQIGHSMGLPISLQVAIESPEAIRSIMATGGAGLDGGEGIVRMGWKAVKLFKNEILDERDALEELGEATALTREVIKHILAHPIDTLAEGYHVSRTNVVPNLLRVHESGIRLGGIIFGMDSFFKPGVVISHVGPYLDWYEVVPDAKHIHPQLQPRRHAVEQVAAFAALNAVEVKPRSLKPTG